MDEKEKTDGCPDPDHRACGRNRGAGHYIHGFEITGRVKEDRV